jgi:peptidoglycan/xylan/chitin deacetylase (PgdA/CDA1 family)
MLKEIMLRVIHLSGIWLVYRWVTRRKVRILMYHGISSGDIGIWTQVPIADFERQMAHVRRWYSVIGLGEACDILRGWKKGPAYPLVITFDDGFLNNRTHAYPVLKKHDMPASIFLTTSFVDKDPRFGGMIRTDYILCLFRQSLQREVDLRDCGLGLHTLESIEQRTQVAYQISGALKRMNHVDENRIIDIIAQRLGAEPFEGDGIPFESLDWSDVKEFHREGLVTIGAHTISHEILTMLPRDKMVWEIVGSKAEIEACLGAPVRFFAYPNGTRDDFDGEVKSEVAARFECALSTIPGLNSPGDDLYELRRIGIGNGIKPWKFKLELSGMIGIMGRLKARLAAGFRTRARRKYADIHMD